MINEFELNLIAPEHYNMAMDIDRYANDPSKLAILWENEQGEEQQISYLQLKKESNKFANALQRLGMAKGDTIIITLPRIPEAYYAYPWEH